MLESITIKQAALLLLLSECQVHHLAVAETATEMNCAVGAVRQGSTRNERRRNDQ